MEKWRISPPQTPPPRSTRSQSSASVTPPFTAPGSLASSESPGSRARSLLEVPQDPRQSRVIRRVPAVGNLRQGVLPLRRSASTGAISATTTLIGSNHGSYAASSTTQGSSTGGHSPLSHRSSQSPLWRGSLERSRFGPARSASAGPTVGLRERIGDSPQPGSTNTSRSGSPKLGLGGRPPSA